MPKLHDSTGETADADVGESARKRIRVDADMKISANEILTSAKLEVDRALEIANTTLHRSQEKALQPPVEKHELQSIKDKEVYTEAHENDTNEKVISGKWVLKPHKARGCLRQHNNDSISENALLSNHTALAFLTKQSLISSRLVRVVRRAQSPLNCLEAVDLFGDSSLRCVLRELDHLTMRLRCAI